jgi:hypothetical protein
MLQRAFDDTIECGRRATTLCVMFFEKSADNKASDGKQGGYKMMGVVLVNMEIIAIFGSDT